MQLEFHQIEPRYRELRADYRKNANRLVASLAEQGQQAPVLVVRSAVEGKYVLIDGYKRMEALDRMGSDTVKALLLPMGEAEALCLTHRQERGKRKTALEDGWLVREIVERHGMTQAETAKKLGHAKSWVSRRLALVRDLPERAEKLVRKGKLSAHGAMRALVPLARANIRDCEKIIEGIKESGLSTRQMERLYVAWRTADRAERRKLVAKPLLYLKAQEAMETSEEPESEERHLRKDIEILVTVSHRATRRVREKIRGQLPLMFKGIWEQARLAHLELEAEMGERMDA